MWYFTWILGLGLALSFGIINALWHEFTSDGLECDSVDADGYAASKAPKRSILEILMRKDARL